MSGKHTKCITLCRVSSGSSMLYCKSRKVSRSFLRLTYVAEAASCCIFVIKLSMMDNCFQFSGAGRIVAWRNAINLTTSP